MSKKNLKEAVEGLLLIIAICLPLALALIVGWM